MGTSDVPPLVGIAAKARSFLVGEHVRFYFDPVCPWCYQTSRWVRRLRDLGEIELSWGLFSLELVNAGRGESMRKGHARSATSLRTALVVDEELGSAATGDFYASLGRMVHEEGAAIEEAATIEAALEDAGLNAVLLHKALADDGSWERVSAQHRALVETTRSFGVPTIALDGGDGPTIFGPVISRVPSDEDAVELFRHVAWLARFEDFSELKRERLTKPDLESVRRRRRA